jgi:hypothetical protein
MDDTDTDDQTLSLTGNNLSIDGGNTIDISSINTDAQDLSLSGNTLSITGDATTVDLSSYLDNTDSQTLSLVANTLAVSGGNSVNLSSYLDNTDAQTLSLVGNTLAVSGGNSVNLSSYLDNTDAQTLSLVGNTLAVSGGNSVDLSSYLDADNLGNHTATQNINMSGHYLSNDGGNDGNVNATGDFFVGNNAGTNSDIWISGKVSDWDNISYYVDPNVQSVLTNVHVDAGVVVNTGGVTVSAGGITVTGNSSVTGTLGVTGVATAPSFTSTVSTGTAPMTVSSTTVVSNLNADLLDGINSAAFVQSANNLSDISNASAARTNLGVAIGTDVQGYNAGLASIAGLVTAADKMIYTTASDVYSTTDLTAFGRSLIGSASAAAGATALGLGTGDAPTFNGLTLTSALSVTGDVKVGMADAFYMGDPTTDGSWRIVRSANDLVFERLEVGVWVTKWTMTP